MTKRYLIKKLSFLIILPIILFGMLQNNWFQNKLVNTVVPSGYTCKISKTKGVFPLYFSSNNIKLLSEDFDINIDKFSFELGKSLTHIKNININKVEAKLLGKSDFSPENLKYILPVIAQKFIRNADISEIKCDDKVFRNIKLSYDKAQKKNYLEAITPAGKANLSCTVVKNKLSAELNLDDNKIKGTYNIDNKRLTLNYKLKDTEIKFAGVIEEDTLKGVTTLPYNVKLDTKLYLKKDILHAELKNKKFGITANLRFDPNKSILYVDNVSSKFGVTIKPFSITDFSKFSDIIISLKKGLIKIIGMNLSKKAFSLGNFFLKDIDISQFPKLGIKGIINGTANYKDNHEVIKLRIDNIDYNSIKVPQVNINANYAKEELVGDVNFNISKFKSKLDFKIGLKDWLPSPISKIDATSKGKFSVAKYKLPNKQIVSGNLSYDIKFSGILEDPVLNGKILIKDGVYINIDYGVYIKDISLNSEFSNNSCKITKIFARDDTKKSGTITGKGEVNWDKNKTYHVSLKIDNFKIIDQKFFKGRLFGNLDLKGSSYDKLSISGKLYTNNPIVDVSVIILPALRNIDILDGVTKPKSQKASSNMPIKIPVNIDFEFKPELKIIGFGIDSTWNGGAVIKGNIPDIKYDLNAELKHGKIDIIDDRFKLKNGHILINNQKTDIILATEKKIEKIKVGVKFQQINASSKISFYSSPYLPNKEIMSYMLFDKPTSEISAGESLALFSAMNKLSGNSSFDMLGKMKTIFGIDSVSIRKNTKSNREEYNTVSIGKKIGKFKVLLNQGAEKNTTGVVVEGDIAKNIKMTVDLTGKDAASVGVLWSKRY